MLKTSLVPQNKINRKKESKKENSSADSASKNNKFYSRKIRSKNAKYSAKITSENASKIISCLAIVAFMCFMLAKPEYYLNSARRGLSLFATSVLPSLFPFYFCSLLLTYMGAVGAISKVGAKSVKLMYNAPKESAYVLCLSMLCGYPVGASTIYELYSAGVISQKDAKCSCSFCSTSGPIFMIGTIGGAIFKNQKVGLIVLAAHYLGAIVNGFLYRKRKSSDEASAFSVQNDVDGILSRAISKATVNMLYVGGYIVLCGMIIDTFELLGIRNLLENFGAAGEPILSVIYSLVEMTRASIECSKCGNLQLATALCAGAVSFGGLSITMQNYTFLSKCGVGFFELMLKKFTQCCFAVLFAFLLGFAL